MLSVSCIGIGNAGNQIAELAKVTKDIPGIAINSSQKDLTNVTHIKRIVVGDQKGAGKNRSDARKFIKEQMLITSWYTQNIVIIQTSASCNIYKNSIFAPFSSA